MSYKYVVGQMLLDLFPNSSGFVKIPKMTKIVCHIGVGSATEKRTNVLPPMVLLTLLVGQKAIPCLSKKAVAGFHLREDIPIGAKVTLRKERMDDFFLTFLMHVLPGLRDFHGITHESIDEVGNLTIGLADVTVFPSLALYSEAIGKKTGMEITFCCNAKTRKQGALFWRAMGVP